LFPPLIGRLGVLWLFYLLVPPASLAIDGASAGRWAGQIVGTAAMLVLFFLGLRARDGWPNGLVVGAMAAISLVLSYFVTPANWGMLIYAAGFASIRRSSPAALAGVLGVMACFALLYALDVIHATALLAGCLLATSIGIGNHMLAKNIELNYHLQDARKELERLAALAERERIGRDLHDVLGQSLSAIVLKSELASRIGRTDPARALAEIAGVERAARDALSQLRAVVQGYKGSGLPAELARARSLLADAGISLEYSGSQPSLSAEQEQSISLILREAVTNVVRHSGARRCNIELRAGEDGLLLIVADDGAGIAGVEGTGIRGMRERAASLGGTLDIVATNPGTEVRAGIPIAVHAGAGA
jgi:two-component system sensor histidine kinase DesK